MKEITYFPLIRQVMAKMIIWKNKKCGYILPQINEASHMRYRKHLSLSV